MFTQVLIVAVVLTATQAQTENAPFALIDDARAELEILTESLLRAIATGHIRLDSYYDRFVTNSNQVQLEGKIIIEFEEQRIHGQVNSIGELAQSSGVDISTCLNYEERIQDITTSSLNKMEECISVEIEEAAKIIVEYKYLIDIYINRAYTLEYQLNLCDIDNEDCILPIYERIQYERKYAAEAIEIEGIKVNNLLNLLRPIVQDCSNLSVSQYVNEVNAILREINECADALLS